MPERFLNLNEAAEILNISEGELSELVAQGKIPAYRIAGKFLRFDKYQIEKHAKTIGAPSQSLPQRDSYAFGERLFDFFYYNDFYLVSIILIALILTVIFNQ